MLDAIVTLPERIADAWGSGAFGAPRGERKHTGVDFIVKPGALLLCPVQGVVTKWGQVYRDTGEYRYIQVTDASRRRHRFYYVEPLLGVGNSTEPGDTLGTVQDIAARYDKRMTNHVHYEIKMPDGTYMNPLEE